jgi:hypothetical protein
MWHPPRLPQRSFELHDIQHNRIMVQELGWG